MKCTHEDSAERIATPFFWILSYFLVSFFYFYVISFISHSLWGFIVFQLDFKDSYHNIRMRAGNALILCDLYDLFLHSDHFSV